MATETDDNRVRRTRKYNRRYRFGVSIGLVGRNAQDRASRQMARSLRLQLEADVEAKRGAVSSTAVSAVNAIARMEIVAKSAETMLRDVEKPSVREAIGLLNLYKDATLERHRMIVELGLDDDARKHEEDAAGLWEGNGSVSPPAQTDKPLVRSDVSTLPDSGPLTGDAESPVVE